MNLSAIIERVKLEIEGKRDVPHTYGYNDCFAKAQLYDRILRGHNTLFNELVFESPKAYLKLLRSRGLTPETMMIESGYVPIRNKKMKQGDLLLLPPAAICIVDSKVLVSVKESVTHLQTLPYNPISPQKETFYRPLELL